MTERIQMTEEQFEDSIEKAYWKFKDNMEKIRHSERDCFKYAMRNIFIKSELQQKVEEAEAMYKLFNSHECNYSVIQIIEKQNEAVQLLKQSHPEFNGE